MIAVTDRVRPLIVCVLFTVAAGAIAWATATSARRTETGRQGV